MGQPFAFGFPELMPVIEPLFEEAVRLGVAQDVVDAPMMVERNGYKEEAFFTGNFTPIRGTEGEVEGFYNALFEVTLQKIYDRRTKLLNLMAATPGGLTIPGVYSHILTTLEDNPHDIPMAILYEADTTSVPGKISLRLRGQLGIPEGHGLLLDGQDLESEGANITIYRQARSGRVVTPVDERFNGLQWLGFQQPTDKVVTLALTTGVRLFGFLTVGTNPYRPFDETCEQFIRDLTRMASSVLASAWDAEDLKQKQEKLQSELAFSDMKVRHLVHHASVGMAHATSDGTIMWANETFLSSADAVSDAQKDISSVYEAFLDEDRLQAERVWARIMGGENHVSAEIRLTRLFVPPIGNPEPAHIQMLAFPYQENGLVASVMVCTTDISRLKWAEAWQTRLAEDAREAKQQQEQFIDVVSHEMRNPLSAIVHSADAISSTLDDLRPTLDMSKIPRSMLDALEDNVSAASIILGCARHQKRIIDDILTLGRLETALLSVNPSAVKPSDLIDNALALFAGELQSNAISVKISTEQSMQELAIDHLYLDPTRVTQIFLNFVTNAIKFTKTRNRREISICYGASLTPPRSTRNDTMFSRNLRWAPKGRNAADVTDDAEWGNGEVVYLLFSLSDTGVGMDAKEMANIFGRFEQASVKTHVNYGGSGLGLYISKELTEKMGGEIGVTSQVGEGSQFVFYIKTKRAKVDASHPPPPETLLSTTLMRKFRVLLVEDNLVNQRVLQKRLIKSNCNVVVANHGLEALEILQASGAQFDVVLMDVQMPVMDGLTCTAEIRKLEETSILKGHLLIVAVTANVRQEQIDHAIAVGAVSAPYPLITQEDKTY